MAAFVNIMLFCDCNILYYIWYVGHVFHFGLYPLNILILTICYLLILKFSTSVLSTFRALAAIAIIWIISILTTFPALFITSPSTFIDCCETVCYNGSALCDTPLEQSFTPRVFSNASNAYFHLRDMFIIIIPSIIVFVATASSYYIYRKASMKASLSLEIRMLLLPILMTVTIAVYLLSQDVINWQPTQTTDERFPGILIFILLHMMWDINGVVFPVLIMFFNVKLRQTCFQVLLCKTSQTSHGSGTVRYMTSRERVVVVDSTTQGTINNMQNQI